MKSKLLMGTALLALVVGTASAGAQTAADPNNSSQTSAQDRDGKPVRVIDTKRPNDNSQAQTPAANTNATTTSGATPAQNAQTTPPANAPASSTANQPSTVSQPSTTNQPSTAQSGQTSPSTTTPSSTTAQQPSSSPSANTANDNKTNTDQPAAAQATPTTQQPSTASGATPAQPNTAQQKAPAANQAATNNGQAQVKLSATLQTEQKTKLSQAFTKVEMKPLTNVNFSLTVGSTVPRTVEFRPLPSSVVAIIPQYRGYNYTLVRDEIVIIEPGTSRIVDVIERGGPTRASTTTTTKQRSVDLSKKQRDYIREHSSRRTTTTTTGAAPRTTTTTRRVTVGDSVPDSVEIESFPEEVYREVPTVRSYRYIRGDRGIYLVDPQRRVIIDDLDD